MGVAGFSPAPAAAPLLAQVLNAVQALLLKRDTALLDVVESLFQLELDEGDSGLLLLGERLVFVVANLLKCLRCAAVAVFLARRADLDSCPCDVWSCHESIRQHRPGAAATRLQDASPPMPRSRRATSAWWRSSQTCWSHGGTLWRR